MKEQNKKIIDAIINKAEKISPNSLGLIGVYGSALTGDEHDKSDLDLLILINDEEGYKLATGFILEDLGIGYDIYCTSFESLENDAALPHAQISKLMESEIVYLKDESALIKLNELRNKAKEFLNSDKRFSRCEEILSKAKLLFGEMNLCDNIADARLFSYGIISFILDAVMIFNGRYFTRGIKRTFEEISDLNLGEEFFEAINNITKSKDIISIRENSKILIKSAENHIKIKKEKAPTSKNLAGTYEEMYSNWRNKMEEAENNNDTFSSFMNLSSLQYMLKELSIEFDIGEFKPLSEYSPDDLIRNREIFDECLEKYKEIYHKAGLKVKSYHSVEDFTENYIKE